MQNPWTIGLDVLVEWSATLPAGRHADWLRTALEEGERLAVHRVRRVPSLGFDRDAGSDPAALLGADPLLFARPHVAGSVVAFHDAAGAVVERELDDLGEALAPHRVRTRHQPPLALTAFDWSGPTDVPPEVEVAVRIFSDIWLPWTAASDDPDSAVPGFGDNRVLAARHTPRLNAFLAALRAATERAGGRWALGRADLGPHTAFQVDERGVRLAAAPG